MTWCTRGGPVVRSINGTEHRIQICEDLHGSDDRRRTAVHIATRGVCLGALLLATVSPSRLNAPRDVRNRLATRPASCQFNAWVKGGALYLRIFRDSCFSR